jgi:hypothetical protein
VNLLFNGAGLGSAAIDAQLAALRATGATLGRSDAPWELSEPTAPSGAVHHYDWSSDDRIAGALADHGLRWLPIIDYSAPWAQSIPGQDHSPPSSDADYAAYAAAVAARYGPGGAFWRTRPGRPALPVQAFEIWNEPDNAQFWAPTADAGQYARLYAAAHDAIHAVDASARVVVGGLTDAPQFVPEMIAADPPVRGVIDAVAIHPYAAMPAAVVARVAQTRHALDALGLSGVPLYVTEFGWTTSPPGALDYLPETLRPAYIAGTLQALARSGCGIAATILYTWYAPARDPANSQQWFGISGSRRDVAAFSGGLRAAARAPARGGCA